MGTIAIKLDPSKMENPDLDVRYLIPERIEEVTKGKVQDDGYDYSSDDTNSIILFMSSKKTEKYVNAVIEIFKNEKFLDNDIYEIGVIAISNGDAEHEEGYKVIHPSNYDKEFTL